MSGAGCKFLRNARVDTFYPASLDFKLGTRASAPPQGSRDDRRQPWQRGYQFQFGLSNDSDFVLAPCANLNPLDHATILPIGPRLSFSANGATSYHPAGNAPGNDPKLHQGLKARPNPLAAAPRDDDDLDVDVDSPKIEHGCIRFTGEPAARCEKKMKICDYAGLTRSHLRFRSIRGHKLALVASFGL